MSCACEHKKYSEDLERVIRLAKASAKLTGEVMVVYASGLGAYAYVRESEIGDREPIEFISPY